MIKLHVIQAKFGDCFLLEYGEETSPSFMLIDGGPKDVHKYYLAPALKQLMKGHDTIDDVVISHVDNDHIIGVLDLLTALQKELNTGLTPSLTIGELWFNSFSNTIGTKDIESRIGKINRVAAMNNVRMEAMSMALNGIREGSQVIKRTAYLNIPVNKEASNGFYLAAKNNPVIEKANLEITVVGPTITNLKKLQVEWEEWVKKNEQQIADGKYTKEVAMAMDRSVPNFSSIVLLIKADGKTILLTGDCRGDHLQQGLIETGLSTDGKLQVDILKVPHHGSMRNCKQQFFREVTANTYIISADGTNDNPDTELLYWIVEAAKAAGRKIKLVFTNETESTAALLEKYKPEENGYEVEFLKDGWLTTE